MATKKESLL